MGAKVHHHTDIRRVDDSNGNYNTVTPTPALAVTVATIDKRDNY